MARRPPPFRTSGPLVTDPTLHRPPRLPKRGWFVPPVRRVGLPMAGDARPPRNQADAAELGGEGAASPEVFRPLVSEQAATRSATIAKTPRAVRIGLLESKRAHFARQFSAACRGWPADFD